MNAGALERVQGISSNVHGHTGHLWSGPRAEAELQALERSAQWHDRARSSNAFAMSTSLV